MSYPVKYERLVSQNTTKNKMVRSIDRSLRPEHYCPFLTTTPPETDKPFSGAQKHHLYFAELRFNFSSSFSKASLLPTDQELLQQCLVEHKSCDHDSVNQMNPNSSEQESDKEKMWINSVLRYCSQWWKKCSDPLLV